MITSEIWLQLQQRKVAAVKRFFHSTFPVPPIIWVTMYFHSQALCCYNNVIEPEHIWNNQKVSTVAFTTVWKNHYRLSIIKQAYLLLSLNLSAKFWSIPGAVHTVVQLLDLAPSTVSLAYQYDTIERVKWKPLMSPYTETRGPAAYAKLFRFDCTLRCALYSAEKSSYNLFIKQTERTWLTMKVMQPTHS